MAKKKPTHYFCDLWRMNYYFFIGWKAQEFVDYVVKYYQFEPNIPAAGVGKCVWLERGPKAQCLLWSKYTGKLGYPTMAHECLHATNYTLDRAGWEPSLTNDEPQTYLMTNLLRQAYGLQI